MSIDVKTGQLANTSHELKEISFLVGVAVTKVQSAMSTTPSEVRYRSGINSSLNSIISEMEDIENSIEKAAKLLNTASELYFEAERELYLGDGRHSVFSSDDQTDGQTTEWAKNGLKFMGEVGLIGGVLSSFLKPAVSWMDTGRFPFPNSVGSAVSGLKNVTSIVKNISKVVKNEKKMSLLSRMNPLQANKTRFKRLLGLDDIFASKGASQASSWSTRFKNNVNKLDPFESFKKGGATSAFAYIGLGLDFAGNAISNYEEAQSGEIGAGRAVFETVTETVVDVATNWAIGTAVAAGVAATIGSAPVLLTGAITVGVGIGIDAASKALFGVDATEAISDSLLNAGELLQHPEFIAEETKKLVGEGAKAVKNVAKTASKAVSSVAKSAWSGMKKGFGSLF